MAHKSTVKLKTLQLRRMRHMTQAQLATQANLSKTTISNLESGYQTKIELETLAKLCHALDCTPGELIELGETTRNTLLGSQKAALAPFIATSEYNKTFDHKKLDSDLAKITDAKKRGKKT